MLRGIALFPRSPLPQELFSNLSRIYTSKMSATAGPMCPKFVPLEDGQEPASNGSRFRVVSYNILAQVFVKSSFFPHSPSSCLKWKARSQAVLRKLVDLNADLLCIQELDHYESFYKCNMENHGYSCIFVQRTGQKHDGCGIFYKNKSADLILHEEIHYNDLMPSSDSANNSPDIENINRQDSDTSKCASIRDLVENTGTGDRGDPNDPCVRLKRDCVGILSAFKLTDPSQHLVIVANTHIYWDPKWADVKLAQVKYLLLRLTQFKEVLSNKYGTTPSVVVAGDFNSTPGDEVYQYLVSVDAAAEASGAPYKLYSLYGTNGGEPPFTNCTPGFTGTLDYIFLSSTGSLKPVSLLTLPQPDSADVVGGLPNLHHPSDHLPIGGDFEVHIKSNSEDGARLLDLDSDLGSLKIEEDPISKY